MKVAVTCKHLQRDLGAVADLFERAGLDVVTPPVPGQILAGDALVEGLAGCVGVVAGDDQFDSDVLDRLPDLRVISKWGIGIDGIDLGAAAARGITVTNTPGAFDGEVADISLGYIIALARHLVAIHEGVRDGGWPKPPGRSLGGSTLGIVGLGGIGRALVSRARACEMDVVGVDPSPDSAAAAGALGAEVVDLPTLLGRADIVSVNAPLTPATHHLLDRRAFTLAQPGLLLVNTGRGPVVEEAALVEALDAGVVAGAALDVFEEEPLPATSRLRGRPNVIFGSHNASNTMEAGARVHRRAIANLVEALGR